MQTQPRKTDFPHRAGLLSSTLILLLICPRHGLPHFPLAVLADAEQGLAVNAARYHLASSFFAGSCAAPPRGSAGFRSGKSTNHWR